MTPDQREAIEDASRSLQAAIGRMGNVALPIEFTHAAEHLRVALASPAEPERQGWQPIETAPYSGLILIAVSGGNDSRTFFATRSWDEELGWHWWITASPGAWGELDRLWSATHWQPVPPPPHPADSAADARMGEAG